MLRRSLLSIPRVGHHVTIERKTPAEGLVTEPARKGLLAHVALEVSDQRVLVRKRTGAHGTPEGPLSSVGAQVLLQHVLAREALAADSAPERPLSRVNAHVDYHVPLVLCCIAAKGAMKLLGGTCVEGWRTCERKGVPRWPSDRFTVQSR